MRIRVSPRMLRIALNLWPPFLGAGIRVRSIAADWSHCRVEMRQGWLNLNFHRVHFGGSLYAMTDPFPALLLQQQLGPEYKVVDQRARIEFLKPGRGRLTVDTRVPAGEAERLRRAGEHGAKLLPEYCVEVTDQSGAVVARVHRTVYVRRRRPSGTEPPRGTS